MKVLKVAIILRFREIRSVGSKRSKKKKNELKWGEVESVENVVLLVRTREAMLKFC